MREPPPFKGREPVLRQALAAHREGLDAIAVFPLVPIIEGLLWPLLEDLSELAPKEFKKTPYPEKAKTLEKMPLWGFEAMACLIAFLEARLYERWRPSDGPEALDKRLDLNRHRLAHGGLMVGTRPDTVVCFLVLESVAAVLAAADDLMARFSPEQSEG